MVRVERTDQLASRIGTSIVGVYTLTECRTQKDSGHGLVRLEDASGQVFGLIPSEHRASMQGRPLNGPVLVSADVRMSTATKDRYLLIKRMLPATEDEVSCAADLLPLRLCPPIAKPALSRLIELERSLCAPLSGFIKRMLLDPDIGHALLRCRGSVKHHHHYAGGLLVHSTDLLTHAKTLASCALPREPISEQIAQVAYLVHDIGKLKTVGEKERPDHAFVIGHETHNLLVLAKHLDWLERQDARIAAGLRYVLEFIATPAKARKQAGYLVAEIVVMLDQISAASENRRSLSDLLNPAARQHRHTAKPIAEIASNDQIYQERRYAH